MKSLKDISKKIGRGLTALAVIGGLSGCGGDKETKRPEPVERDSAIVNLRNIGESLIRDLDNDGQADVIYGDLDTMLAKYVFSGYENQVRTIPNYTKIMGPVMRTNASDVLAHLGHLEDNIDYDIYLDKIKGATQ